MTEKNRFAPEFRFRRLRQSAAVRQLVRETQLTMNDFILPIFVEEGITEPVAISSMPGVVRYPETQLPAVIQRAWSKGIRAIILFGVSTHKDDAGTDTWNDQGLLARMIRAAPVISSTVSPRTRSAIRKPPIWPPPSRSMTM